MRKGETSKASVLRYYSTNDGVQSLNNRVRYIDGTPQDFLETINDIEANQIYSITIGTRSIIPRKIYEPCTPEEWSVKLLLVPFWMSVSGVTFVVLASSPRLTSIKNPNNKLFRRRSAFKSDERINFRYGELCGRLKKVPFSEVKLWKDCEYKNAFFSLAVEGRKFHISEKSIGEDESFSELDQNIPCNSEREKELLLKIKKLEKKVQELEDKNKRARAILF